MHSHYSIGRGGGGGGQSSANGRADGDICGGCSIGGLDNELADWPTRRAKGSSGQVLSGQSAVESVIRRANNGKEASRRSSTKYLCPTPEGPSFCARIDFLPKMGEEDNSAGRMSGGGGGIINNAGGAKKTEGNGGKVASPEGFATKLGSNVVASTRQKASTNASAKESPKPLMEMEIVSGAHCLGSSLPNWPSSCGSHAPPGGRKGREKGSSRSNGISDSRPAGWTETAAIYNAPEGIRHQITHKKCFFDIRWSN
ncbi:hypothetical protein GPALN_002030 [Globodera pallida]|nr:hypothetical protein GPALN_002030 [Globodera pallida]